MKFLVVDDERIILNAVVRVLKTMDFEVISLSTGKEIEKELPGIQPDFIFLDVKMPGCSGIDVLRVIKNFNPKIKVVMMSGYTSPEVLEEAKNFGADAFLKKPFDDILDIIKIVKELMED